MTDGAYLAERMAAIEHRVEKCIEECQRHDEEYRSFLRVVSDVKHRLSEIERLIEARNKKGRGQ